MAVQIDDINRTDGVTTSEDSYGIYYPYDGLLGGGFDSFDAAQKSIDAARPGDNEWVDAYVVKIKIERVDS